MSNKTSTIEKPKIDIVPYRDTDINEALNLLTVSFGHSFSRERWMWLHYKNLMAPSLILEARTDGILAGIYAAIKKQIIVEGKVLLAARDIDPVVRPDLRGLGIFSKLLKEGERLFSEIKLYVNFANDLSKPGFISRGWKEIRIKYLFAPKVPLLAWLYRVIFLEILNYRIVSKGIFIYPINTMDEFLIEDHLIHYERPVYVKKTKLYLDWRYKGNPDKTYYFFKAVYSGTETALIICSENNGRLSILDIINQGPLRKEQILKEFLRYYICSSHKMTLITWDTLCDGADKLMIFGKMGGYLVKNRSQFSDELIFNSRNWEFGPGESEFL